MSCAVTKPYVRLKVTEDKLEEAINGLLTRGYTWDEINYESLPDEANLEMKCEGYPDWTKGCAAVKRLSAQGWQEFKMDEREDTITNGVTVRMFCQRYVSMPWLVEAWPEPPEPPEVADE